MAPIKNVAVIGAGPGGLAAAKYLVAEKAFSSIVVFEQRLNVGGVWNATPDITEDKSFTVPQTRPIQAESQPIWKSEENDTTKKLQFLSPIYDNLETNIPHTLMNYSDLPFPKDTALFPHFSVVLEYLERYADDVRHLIRFGTQVLKVHPIVETGKWSVTTHDLKMKDSVSKMTVFDAVIVANGHYNDPFVPTIKGIEEWNTAYPGSISHSKYYRRPDEFKNKKVLIVGNSASGVDLASQLFPICAPPLLISARSTSPEFLSSSSSSPTTTTLPEITEFLPLTRSIRFANNHIESSIDHILFCTGYLYSYPFLTSSHLAPLPPLVEDPYTRTQNLYQHIFYAPLPTLSFIGLPQRIVPFPISESQAAVIARFLSGRLALPSPTTMEKWESSRLKEKGDGKAFHVLGYPADAEYINRLYEWAGRAERREGRREGLEGEGLENKGRGKTPPFWGEETCWVRERTPRIKLAARALGDERGKVRTLAELGFDYEAEKAAA